MVELPKELWAVVLGNLEDVQDFGRAQLISQTFHALVQDKCWTKIRKIEVFTKYDSVVVVVDTAVPHRQELRLPILQPGLILEKLVQKAIKTTEIYLELGLYPMQDHDQAICRFLLALATIPDVKILKFSLNHLPRFMNIPLTAIPKALAIFLNAKNKSLTSLVINNFCYDSAELMQAFRDSHALEYVSFKGPKHYIRSVLLGKTQLKTLKLAPTGGGCITAFFAVALLESEAALLKFMCSEEIVPSYFQEVHRRNLMLSHPLRSLQKLTMGPLIRPSSFPWSLFPHLQQFFIYCVMSLVSIESFVQLVHSFLLEWAGATMEKTLEWQISCLELSNGQEEPHDVTNEELLEAVAMVQAANGCQVTITHRVTEHQNLVTFRKGNATLKVSVGHTIDHKFIF